MLVAAAVSPRAEMKSGRQRGAQETEPAACTPPRSRLDVPDRKTRGELFRRMDYNGNGGLSLAEIDKAVIELYPEYNHKPSLMRAYKAADVTGDGFIQRKEFRKLLHYLVYFNNVWHLFEQIDSNGDRRLDAQEFIEGCRVVGIEGLSPVELEREFGEIDGNGGGFVLFDEFCSWCAAHHYGEVGGEEETEIEMLAAGERASGESGAEAVEPEALSELQPGQELQPDQVPKKALGGARLTPSEPFEFEPVW